MSDEFPAELVEHCRDEACRASGGYSPSSVEIVAVLRASGYAELVAALENIGKQMLLSEMGAEQAEYGDYEGAYETMIKVARAALAAAGHKQGSGK